MGSFNRTCAVSQASIGDGDKVRIFYLVTNVFDLNHYSKLGLFKQSDSSSNCYPTDNYSIIGLPLLATYSDENFFEFEDENMENIQLAELNNHYKPNRILESADKEDYNSSHDYLNIEKLDSMEIVQDMILSGSLRVDTPFGVASVVEMVIHEDIYQKLILKDGWKKEYQRVEYISFDDETEQHLKDAKETEQFLKDNPNSFFRHHDKLELPQHENWSKLTQPKKLIIEHKDDDIKTNIAKAWAGARRTECWFQNNFMAFQPNITSPELSDLGLTVDRLVDLAQIINNINLKKSKSNEDDFHFVETVITKKSFIDIDNISSKIMEWYKLEPEIIEAFNYALHEFNVNKKYTVGDKSRMDLFFDNFDIIREGKGTVIHLKD